MRNSGGLIDTIELLKHLFKVRGGGEAGGYSLLKREVGGTSKESNGGNLSSDIDGIYLCSFSTM